MYDLIIIGMGISGISAAIYAKRNGLKVLLLDKSMPGGIINEISVINNYPGFKEISGPELAQKLLESIQDNEIEYKLEMVSDVIFDDIKTVKTNNNVYQAKYLIIAMGRKPRMLGLEKEKEYWGRGISTCALCDGPLYKNKEVALVGGGSSAVGEAISLAKIVKKVYLIHRRDSLRSEEELSSKLKNYDNIEVILNEEVKDLIIENDTLVGVKLNNRELRVEGLFIYIGFIPNTEIFENTNLKMEDGYIVVDENQQTNILGVYACGDITKKSAYQIVTGAAEGAIAAIKISQKSE